jgi:hypothetical protein
VAGPVRWHVRPGGGPGVLPWGAQASGALVPARAVVRAGAQNGWTLAEFAGDGTQDGMQRLLNAARWDEDEVRDRLVRYVAAELGDLGAVLIADETGFEKTGVCSVGCSGRIRARPGRSPTARSACSWLRRACPRAPGADRPGAVHPEVVDRRPG